VQAPLLTVAIPTLRRLGYLQEAVHSALAQDYPSFEVLVSNDGNDEPIRQYMREMVQHSDRLRYVETPGGLGLSGNWNWCAERAAGSHLVIIGDDDRLLPSFLSSLAPRAPDHDVVFCNHFRIDADGHRCEDSERQLAAYGRGQLKTGPLGDPERVAWMNAVGPSATLVRTELVRTLKFNPELNTPELEFYVRAARQKATFFFDSRFLSEFRSHAGAETVRGLWFDRLLFALLAVEASSPAGNEARASQLRDVARTAALQALATGRVEVARAVLATGKVEPRAMSLALEAVARSGPKSAEQFISTGRALKRLARRLHRLVRSR
jgi:glycosyltransferase involved in cell wall biosynthesis